MSSPSGAQDSFDRPSGCPAGRLCHSPGPSYVSSPSWLCHEGQASITTEGPAARLLCPSQLSLMNLLQILVLVFASWSQHGQQESLPGM